MSANLIPYSCKAITRLLELGDTSVKGILGVRGGRGMW
jgi:hypothetical protein